MLVLHSLNSGKDILPAQGSLQISKEEDSSLQMTHPMNKQVRVREDCLEEVQESWVCSSNDREDIQVKKAHLEGVINKDKIYSVGTCRFYTKCCMCINSFNPTSTLRWLQ